MAEETPEQKATIRRVMHEYKHGELPKGAGGKVRNPKQAIAIALKEAGASNRQTPAKNMENLRRTKTKEHAGETAEARAEGKAAQDRTLKEGRK